MTSLACEIFLSTSGSLADVPAGVTHKKPAYLYETEAAPNQSV